MLLRANPPAIKTDILIRIRLVGELPRDSPTVKQMQNILLRKVRKPAEAAAGGNSLVLRNVCIVQVHDNPVYSQYKCRLWRPWVRFKSGEISISHIYSGMSETLIIDSSFGQVFKSRLH